MNARKKYDVHFPDMYADKSNKDAHMFNCVQRAHKNTLEELNIVQILILVNGIFFPRVAASLGGAYCVARLIYSYGYTTGKEDFWLFGGIISNSAETPLVIMCFVTGYNILISYKKS